MAGRDCSVKSVPNLPRSARTQRTDSGQSGAIDDADGFHALALHRPTAFTAAGDACFHNTEGLQGLFAPDISYKSAISLSLGSRKILVSFAPGHTGGDSLVVIPDANVLFCGDLFWRKTLPNLIDATTKDWGKTLVDLGEAAAPARSFVPGHGAMSTFGEERRNNPFVGDSV